MMQHGRHAAHRAVQPRAQQPVEQLVEVSAIPMAVHVGFTEPEAAECEHAGRHAGIVQPDVPRSGAVDPHIGLGQQLLDIAPCTVIPVRSLRWNQTFGSAHGQCILDRFGGGLRQRPQSGSAWSGSAPSAGDRSRHAWRLSATGRRLTVEPMLSGTRARKKIEFLNGADRLRARADTRAWAGRQRPHASRAAGQAYRSPVQKRRPRWCTCSCMREGRPRT